jgi:hypothetical protein
MKKGYAEISSAIDILLTKEKDPGVRTFYFMNIATAFTYTNRSGEIDFGPLLNGLDEKDPRFHWECLVYLVP